MSPRKQRTQAGSKSRHNFQKAHSYWPASASQAPPTKRSTLSKAVKHEPVKNIPDSNLNTRPVTGKGFETAIQVNLWQMTRMAPETGPQPWERERAWVRLAKGKGSQENGCCMWFLLEFYVYCFQSPVLLTAEYQNNAISKLSLPCNYLLLWLLTLSLFQLTATHSPFPPWSNWSCAQLPSLQQIFAPLSCAPDAILNIRYGLVQISMIPNLTKFSL